MLRKQAVSKKLLGLVETLQQIPALDDFVLVGGTSLALQLGHRISEDIDLFTQNDIDQAFIRLVRQPGWLSHSLCGFSGYSLAKPRFLAEVVWKLKFPNNSIIETLHKEFGNAFSVSALSRNTINCVISNIKIDILRHAYPYVGRIIREDGLRLLKSSDIAAMKLNAIAGNGTRVKDFIDVYFLLDRFSLKQMVSFYKKKYAGQDIYHVRKSLTYFDDIPSDSWKTVRLIQEKGLDFDTMKTKLLKSVSRSVTNATGKNPNNKAQTMKKLVVFVMFAVMTAAFGFGQDGTDVSFSLNRYSVAFGNQKFDNGRTGIRDDSYLELPSDTDWN